MDGDSFRRRLLRFYGMYSPACVSSVDAMCRTYRGREEDIFRVLVDKYGPEPPLEENTGGDSYRMQISMRDPSLNELALPQNVSDLQGRTESGRNSKYIADQKKELFSSFTATDMDENEKLDHRGESTCFKSKEYRIMRGKLIEFYRIHNESMIPFVEELIETYSGNEEMMFEDLQSQYNETKKSSPPMDSSPSPMGDVNLVMKRLGNALEIKTAETLALKKDKEYLLMELNASNSLLEQTQRNEKQMREELQVTKEKLRGRYIGVELERKTAEISLLQNVKEHFIKEITISNMLLESIQEKENLLRSQLRAAEEQLRSKEDYIGNEFRQKDKDKIRENNLEVELLRVKRECSALRSSEIKLGNRIRVLEVKKQQLLDELREAEKRIFDVGDLLSIEHQKKLSLIEEIGNLKLATDQLLGASAFSSIVKEIKNRFSEHYESELAQYRKEMNEYSLYAENQLRRRDILIAELSADHCDAPSERYH